MSKAVLTIHPKWCELIASSKKVVSTIKLELDITGATLLTVEEAKQLPKRLRQYNNFWWLQSRGRLYHLAKCVLNNGRVFESGIDVICNDIVVRPALTYNPQSSNIKVGDTFTFGEQEFEVISEGTAFCLGDIGECAFRGQYGARYANIYDKSDVKKYIDTWYEEITK